MKSCLLSLFLILGLVSSAFGSTSDPQITAADKPATQPAKPDKPVEVAKKERIAMLVYMAADSNLHDFAILDIDEIRKAMKEKAVREKFNVAVYFDGSGTTPVKLNKDGTEDLNSGGGYSSGGSGGDIENWDDPYGGDTDTWPEDNPYNEWENYYQSYDELSTGEYNTSAATTITGNTYIVEWDKDGNEIWHFLGERNSGDVRDLDWFARWGYAKYRNEKRMLVLWNHGTGWKDHFKTTSDNSKYEKPEPVEYDPYEGKPVKKEKPATKPVADWDDASNDVVQAAIGMDEESSQEISLVQIEKTLADLKKDKMYVHVTAMDACLMATVEGAYQLRNVTDLLLFSEETEPMDGWDYEGFLKGLTTTDYQTIGKHAVDAYMEYYRKKGLEKVTQSAVLTSGLEGVAVAVYRAKELLEKLPVKAWVKAMGDSVAYTDRDQKDLLDFLNHTGVKHDVDKALAAVVVSSKAVGLNVKGSTGLSIYVPEAPSTCLEGGDWSGEESTKEKAYEKLAFPKRTGWLNLLRKKYVEACGSGDNKKISI